MQYSSNQKVFTKKNCFPIMFGQSREMLVNMDLTSVNNYVFVLLYSCFLLFILWGSAFMKFIMLANSYIHKKDISIVYVYHVNLVKLYTIYHRKMMLFFSMNTHEVLVFLLANMESYWILCWWLILLSYVIDMVTSVMTW